MKNDSNNKSPINSQLLGEYLHGNGLLNDSNEMKDIGENSVSQMQDEDEL